MNQMLLKKIVKKALDEDIGPGDITSEAIFQEDFEVTATFTAKSPGVAAGFPVVVEVFHQLDPRVSCNVLIRDGIEVNTGSRIGNIQGSIKSILAGERVALNFLQRLSGIATQTNQLVQLVSGFPIKIVDTRKTTPGLRMLEKYAVRMGGGCNHRFNLADAVLIKDNHIAACGSVKDAVIRAKNYVPHTMKVEVEVENEAQVREALEAGADIILLDNMHPDEMARMVKLINGRAIVEASGNINEKTIREVANTGVDIISVGSITHSVRSMDISLEIG
jgi:nicotinate-nucleotide pyrophosphorylase (carboxylating)